MKILCAFGKHNYGKAERGVGYEYANFLPALRNLGHEVEFFELWDRSVYASFAELNLEFLRAIERMQPDMVLCVTMTTELWLETLEFAHRGSGAAFMHWNTDDSWKYESCSRLIAPGFDLMATTYLSAIEKAEKEGFDHFVLTQWAANSVTMQPPLPASECRYQASFVGSAYGNRLKWIESLKEYGIDVACFGHGWPNGSVAAEEIPRIMRESVVSLNFADSGVVMNGMLPERSRQIKARVFEVPGAGGLLMTEEADRLGEYYLPDREIVLFDSVENLAEGIKRMNDEHEVRDAMAHAAHERTVHEHSYENRFEILLTEAVARRAVVPVERQNIDLDAFEKLVEQHRPGFVLKLLRMLLLLPCRLIWGEIRGARALRRFVFELSWRISGAKSYSVSGWPGRLFYHES
ncbi:CgeB family protein [Mariprofundus ferrooxydans]|uniref:CgeB family protein n=1 Tax=Mariprofundus ferrooxydans TaxID=314344 RepID=UPI00142FB684|nr:glycosyltransferase [Mariprofundus ferrooxydans]